MGQDDRLLHLVDRTRWQRLQDHFANVLGIPLRTVGPDRQLLVNPSWPAGLDAERTVALLHMGEELEPLLPEARPEGARVTTVLGVTYAAVPISAGTDGAVAYFVAGPLVVGPREDEQAFRQRAESLGQDGAALWALLLSLKLCTHAATRSLLSLLEDVGTSLAQCAFQTRQLPPALAGPRVHQAVTSCYTDRIVQALLKASLAATHAEGGSVMLFDEGGQALQIKAAQGLSGTVIAGTYQPRGAGLAGLAVAERRILLVDRDTTDVRLLLRMSRRDIVSSLIAPLATAGVEEPIGVLNLRSGTVSRRFTEEHVELLKRLLELASAALGGLRLANVPAAQATTG